MLRVLLPPNLAATAPRDAIAVKIELTAGAAPVPALLPALALLQRLCGTPVPPPFFRLTRAQLRELTGLLSGQPVFFWVNRPAAPITWNASDELYGVTEHLDEPSPAMAPESVSAPAQPATPAARPGAPIPGKIIPLPDDEDDTSLTVDGSEHYLALTLPTRESAAYPEALALVKAHGFQLEPSNRKWWLRDRHKTLNFLAAHSRTLRERFHAEFTANFEKNTAHLRFAEIACEAVEARDSFNLTLALKAGNMDEVKIREHLSASRGYLEDEGTIYLIDRAKLESLAAAQRALADDASSGSTIRRTHRIPRSRLVEAQAVLEELAPHFQPPETWRARSEALRNLSALTPAPVPAEIDALLRPYQRIGIAWLWHLYQNELAGILADEMGLGKTLQALGFLAALQATSQISESGSEILNLKSAITRRPSLVVCPASLVENWRREAARFTPQLRVFVHHGAQRLAAADLAGYDLVVTSYGTLVRDREMFAAADLDCVIGDEAQHLKNRRTQNAQALCSLRARGRFLLTGTPVENSLDDLRSLFDFLLPGYVEKAPPDTRREDRAWFDARLRAKTAPYLLRRTKAVVAPELPPKIEQVIYCEPSSAQAALYREIQESTERELFDLEAGGATENSLRLAALTQLLRLRQVCCDPRLLDKNSKLQTPNSKPESYADSAKLDAFRELLEEAIDDGHRILVFSQFTSLLALLRAELDAQEITHCYLDGSMTPRARQIQVDRFNITADIPVFLISLKAGGTGLNLASADTVVHFDPWWNPAVEAQATDRAHRLGQTRVVTSYKLICAGTVEEKVLALQQEKKALLADVFEASDAANAKLSLADLKALLKG